MASKFVLLILLFYFMIGKSISAIEYTKEDEENPATTNLRNYIRINTAQPNPGPGYDKAIKFLSELANDIGLDFNLVHMEPPNLFAVCMAWNGSNPELKSILFNSHMDVVAADPTKWKYPPFDAYKDANGRIWGRGSFDMKSTTISELEAIRKLKQSGFQPLRTIHVTVIPGEEVGGLLGMKAFVETDYFKNVLNVGFDIDEGPPTNRSDLLFFANEEKNAWKFNVTATGIASHGSDLPQYTAAQRLETVINRLFEFRQIQYLKTLQGEPLEHLTTVNLARMGGGISDNSIPDEVWASFDMRIRQQPRWTFKDVDAMLDKILKEARLGSTSPAENVTINFLIKSEETGRTAVDISIPWWTVTQDFCRELNVSCVPIILIPQSDARFIRNVNIPAFGTNLFPNSYSTAHQDNEFVDESAFLAGIDRYAVLMKHLSMVPGNITP